MTFLGKVDVVVLGAGIVGCSFASLLTHVRSDLTVALVTRDSIFSANNTQLSLGVDMPTVMGADSGELVRDAAQARDILAATCPSLRGRHQNAIRVVHRADAASFVNGNGQSSGLSYAGHLDGHEWKMNLEGDMVMYDSPPIVVHRPEEVVAQLAGSVHVSESGMVFEHFTVARWCRLDDEIRIEDHSGRKLSAQYVFAALGSGLVSSPFFDLAPPGLGRRRVAAARLRIEALHWGGTYLFESDKSFLVSADQPGTFWMSLTSNAWLDKADPVGDFSHDDHRELNRIRVRYLNGVDVEVLEYRVGDDLYSQLGTPPVVRVQDKIVLSTGCGGSGLRLGPGVARNALRLLGLA